MITREILVQFFEYARNQRDQQHSNFDIDGDCVWAFFFIDNDIEKLKTIARYLEPHGFQFIGFIEPKPEDQDQKTIHMRLDKIERHSVDTLLERNQYFHDLAEEYDIWGYDGMDVFEIPTGKFH